jgi:hypothetical protein
LHGVAARLEAGEPVALLDHSWFTMEMMVYLHEMQRHAAYRAMFAVDQWARKLTRPTRLTITADHGEAFGEGGWFGHGNVSHPVVLDVPWFDVLIDPRHGFNVSSWEGQ